MRKTITAQLPIVNNCSGTYQTVIDAVECAAMDIYETRRLNLRKLIKEQFGGVVLRCADALVMKPPQLHRWLSAAAKSRQNMDEKSARNIEMRLSLQRGYLDHPHNALSEPSNVVPGPANAGLSAEELKLLTYFRESGLRYRKTILDVAKVGPDLKEKTKDADTDHDG